MDFIRHLHVWVIGETAQGWVMVVAGSLMSIAALLILKSDNALLRGMLIPVALLVAMNLGYGSVLLSRPATSLQIEASYRQSQKQTVERELEKAKNNEKYYRSSGPAWALLTAGSVLSLFLFRGNYLRGLSLGLAAMFLGALFIDSFLHNRLLVFIEALRRLPI